MADFRQLRSLFEDDDDMFFLAASAPRRKHTYKQRSNYFEEMDDVDFFRRFRLTKPTTLVVLEQIESEIETVTDRNHAVKPIDKLLLALRFYALGGTLKGVGDFVGVGETTARNIVKQVSIALARLRKKYIKMPTTNEELVEAHSSFYAKGRIPRVIGAIDCTHIRIRSRGGEQAEYFRNRKDYFSLNVQTVAASDLRIIDLEARWPGSVHDQTIFDNSKIKNDLQNRKYGNSILVGDGGYANTPYLITPVLNASSRVEEVYNEAITRTRNVVERQYGVWKRRFPILSTGMAVKTATVQDIIVATAVLHNVACIMREDIPPIISTANVESEWNIDPLNSDTNMNARQHLLLEYFPRFV